MEHGKVMSASCPVCGSQDHDQLFPDYKGRCVTSQMFFLENISLTNCCCRSCGFIFNAQGLRGLEEEVYNSETWKPKPQIQSFGKNVKTSHQRALETFLDLARLPERGSMLDFGAGTGAFLREWSAAFPRWDLSAIEPGGGYAMLDGIANLKEVFNGPYYQWQSSDKFEAVVVMSVLEHINDPLSALSWIRKRLAPGGILLMQHPNFALLPGDLFCADHINKMTLQHTEALCRHAGFKLRAKNTEAVMFYYVLTADQSQSKPLPNCYQENAAIARQAEQVARGTIEAVEKAVENARRGGGTAAVFGTSPIGSMAHLILDCKEHIACLVDENRNVWGREIDGIQVVGPDRMAEMNVTDLALAISPVYWQAVAKKMSAYQVRVHVPEAGA
jgi:SAM-dependent methyltransferase